MSSENKLKNKLREATQSWSEAYETRGGSGMGYPDLQFLFSGGLLPVEVKKGKVDEDRLRCHFVRPSQISWHRRFAKVGGHACLVVCWEDEAGFHAWSVYGVWDLSEWRKGWDFENCVPWVRSGVPEPWLVKGDDSWVRA